MKHATLKTLRIVDTMGRSPVLDCPSLEELRLYVDRFEVHCAKNFDSWCPRLKSVRLERVHVMNIRQEEPSSSEFVHATVEELECCTMVPMIERIACPKLTKLVLRGDTDSKKVEVAFPVVECLKLLHLELHGYSDPFSILPSILAKLLYSHF